VIAIKNLTDKLTMILSLSGAMIITFGHFKKFAYANNKSIVITEKIKNKA
jgi:hypothetical protein